MSPLALRQICGKKNVFGVGVFLVYLAALLTWVCFYFCVQKHRGNNLYSVSIKSTTRVLFPWLGDHKCHLPTS